MTVCALAELSEAVFVEDWDWLAPMVASPSFAGPREAVRCDKGLLRAECDSGLK